MYIQYIFRLSSPPSSHQILPTLQTEAHKVQPPRASRGRAGIICELPGTPLATHHGRAQRCQVPGAVFVRHPDGVWGCVAGVFCVVFCSLLVVVVRWGVTKSTFNEQQLPLSVGALQQDYALLGAGCMPRTRLR